MNGQYRPGDVVLGNWTLVNMVGEGSFGRVFEAEREDFGTTYRSAIKIITIPQSQSEIISAISEGMDDESIAEYFRSFVMEIVREFALMSELKGTANIVSYEDHTVLPHSVGIGWDIIIRMELLTPLMNYTVGQNFSRHDAIKLGMDICRALELCQKFNIVHRDIKPENILVSKLGDYKLGDFGIARTVEKTTSGLSKKGTYTYMAPEIYRGEAYGFSVDVYSLGIVLYRLLNNNRAPFLPDHPAPITHGAREKAMAMRISGAKLPNPKNADGRLAEIILKACSHDPRDRYSSPGLMRQELEAILYSRDQAKVIFPQGDAAPVEPVEYAEDNSLLTQRINPPAQAAQAGGNESFEETVLLEDYKSHASPALDSEAGNEEEGENWYSFSDIVIKDKKLAAMVYSEEIPSSAVGLELCKHRLSDLTPLESLTNLIYLDLGQNEIWDLEPLSSLISLRELYLWDNQISDLEPLRSLAKLTTLNLWGNQISNLEPLRSLTSLQELYLWSNQIKDVSPLHDLTNLRKLDLEGNPIDYPSLQALMRALPDCDIR